MSRRVNPQISVRPSAKVNEKIIEARRQQEAAEAADHDQSESGVAGSKGAGSKSGISDSAATYQPGGVADGMTTPDAGPGSAGSSEQAHFVGAAPSGAQGAIAAAEGSIANGFGGATLTDGGREEVDVEDVIAAGTPASRAREDSRSMLFEDAANGDGSTGIAEMGRGAMADGTADADKDKEATAEEIAKIAEQAKAQKPNDSAPISTYGTSKEMPNGDIKTVVPDVGSVDLPGSAGEMVNQVNSTTHARERQIDLETREDAPVNGGEDPASGNQKPATTSPAETPGLKNPPEDLADGSTLYADDNWVSVHHPDGTTETKTFADDGTVTTVTRDAHGKETGRTKGSYLEQPDPEDSGDRFRYVSEGLKERLGPKGVDGGGDIDYGDDVPFGVGANVHVPNTQGALLGDAGRLNGIDDGPATSGGGALDPSGNGGAIDYDEAPLGGGLEDDPLAGTGPQRDLDDVLGSDDDDEDDDTSDDADADDSVDATA